MENITKSKEEILAELTEIIAEKFVLEPSEIKEESKLVSDLGADSLDVVELTMQVEKSFGVSIPDSDAGQFKTVGDVAAYLHNTVNA